MSNEETRQAEEARPEGAEPAAETSDANAAADAAEAADGVGQADAAGQPGDADPSEEAAKAAEDPTGTTPPVGAPDDGRDDEPEGPSAEGSAQAASQDEEPDPLAEAERQRDEYLDHLRRERAEFENFRRRSAKERAEALDRGAEQLVGSLIGVLDNFGFLLEAAKDSSDEQLAKGTQMVYAELMDILGKAGLEQVPGEGEPFDPAHHEAMMQVEAEEPVDHPVVAQVLRPGYRFKDRVLRPASVSVKQ